MLEIAVLGELLHRYMSRARYLLPGAKDCSADERLVTNRASSMFDRSLSLHPRQVLLGVGNAIAPIGACEGRQKH
jgi:hypothetical protein